MPLQRPPRPSIETSNKPYRTLDYTDKAKGMSLYVLIFSIFMYIFILYIFNISPRSLLNNTKFWFVILNSLVFIIATDYKIFSSFDENQDLYGEYSSYTAQSRNNASSFVTQYPEIVKRSFYNEYIEVPLEKKKVVIVPKNEPQERIIEVIKSEPKELNDDIQENKSKYVAKVENEYAMQKKMKEARKFSRSKSERYSTKVGINNNCTESVMRRSNTKKNIPREDDNEFSTMSDEELNRRVEEFIQRFNRQIRLQRDRN